ncbi:T9SS type A sorting domain-containing protein [candidate division KSB1 bacterium]|nr:T9SS type A sorting domain-containing protein [candidate division KSB1 bacterium]
MMKKLLILNVAFLLVLSMTGLASAQNPVTFQVDMSLQTFLGNFNPAADVVTVRGGFNDWAGATPMEDPESDGVYTLVADLGDALVGTAVEYKFVMIPSGGGDVWESISNRSFVLAAGGQTLDVVFFDDVSTIPATAWVTFQADMADLLDKGWFDPAEDSIRVVGGFNGWGNEESMVPDPFDPSLYLYDAEVSASVGQDIEWKFRAYPTDNFADNGWSAGSNYKFTFTGEDMVLDPEKPNILPSGSPLAQDVTVRFTVDVNGALDWYNKEPFQNIQGVFINGDFLGWPGSWGAADTAVLIKMYDDGVTQGDAMADDGIWTAEYLKAAGTGNFIIYKYGIWAEGTDTLNNGVTPLDNEAGFSMNHSTMIDDTNPVFINVTDIFGSQWKNLVTFRVNMSIQQTIGNFNPETDKVVVRGAFNDWGGVANECKDMDGDHVFTHTAHIDSSWLEQNVEYKFVMIPAGGGDVWESINNRSFVGERGLVLDVVYFDDVSTLPSAAFVTFQADMSDLLDKGWFDPSTDSIRVVGGFNGWGNEESMVPDPFDPSLYIYDVEVDAAIGSNVEWKFRAYPTDHFADDGWSGGSNYSFEFTGQDIVLDPVQPNILPAGSPLAQDVTVRFTCDVNDAIDYYNQEPFQNIQGVYINGDFLGWPGSWGVADVAVLIPMFDDGSTDNDAVANDGIWTAEYLMAAGEGSFIIYKYGIMADGVDTLNNGVTPLDNEAGFAMNHSLLIPDDSPLYTPPTDVFGSQWRTVSVRPIDAAALPTEFALRQNYPNPFNPTTEIVYDLPKNVNVELTVYNSLGQKIAVIVNEKQDAGTYQATWDGLDLYGNSVTSGVYFYRINAGEFQATKKMMFIK